jgi:hypothetical protein
VAKANKAKRNEALKDSAKRGQQTDPLQQNEDKKELFDAGDIQDREDPTKYPAW